ncbi:hypothetical protein E1B28_006361 [Marasmius oreades]|uniref:Uncharacterized protein n=1 Tax=Marasmius oreades TaxID=181124 RepID=A0A9P7S841_9AGAR|nr:uncharacterized protein E1B28_006361 [Marasmius oreades]KAG7095638.1 hypothetical protein E1B28_006361 [Marasmius oreades]
MLLPCSSSVDIQMIGFPSRLPSSCSILLYFLAGLFLFLAVRFVIHRNSAATVVATSSGDKEKRTAEAIRVEQKASSWRLFTWESLPVSLPITLTTPPNPTIIGRGVGVKSVTSLIASPPPPRLPTSNHTRSQKEQAMSFHRRGPTFEQPLPAIYQSQEPLSMAKLIMSRHTLRRPSPKSLKRSSSAPPTPSRPHTMV